MEPMIDKVMVFTRTKEFRKGKIADSYEFSYKAGDLYFTDVAICSKQTVKVAKR